MAFKISVIGAGVVGQATGQGFLAHGYGVQFIDVKEDVVLRLKKKGFEALTPKEFVDQTMSTQVSVITVATPTADGKINLDPLKSAAADLGRRLARAISIMWLWCEARSVQVLQKKLSRR